MHARGSALKANRFKYIFCWAIFLLLLMPYQHLVAEVKVTNFQVVKGVAIHLGVIPAALIEKKPEAKGKEVTAANKEVNIKNHTYHITVALFDNESKKRITEAKVWARLSENWFSGRTQELEQMLIADTITFGNTFELPDEGPYQIQIQIHLPGEEKVIKTNFDYLNIWASQKVH